MNKSHGWVSYALEIVAVLIALALVTDNPITAAELVEKLMIHQLMKEAIKAIARIVITLINKKW